MDKHQKRKLITVGIIVLVLTIVLSARFCGQSPTPTVDEPAPTDASDPAVDPGPGDTDRDPGEPLAPDSPDDTDDPSPADADASERTPLDPSLLAGLRAVAPSDGAFGTDPAPLGSLDPDAHDLLVELTRDGAGMHRIVSSRHWKTVSARLQARRHYREVDAGAADPAPLPPDDERLVIQESRRLHWYTEQGEQSRRMPVMALHSVFVSDPAGDDDDAVQVSMLGEDRWVYAGDGRFISHIVNASDEPILRIVRAFALTPSPHGIHLTQSIENLTDGAIDVRPIMYSPSDMPFDPSSYIDRRRFRIGYLLDPAIDPERLAGVRADERFLIERADIFKRVERATSQPGEIALLWPDRDADAAGEDLELSWFAITSRYFAMTLYPSQQWPLGSSRASINISLESVVDRISPVVDPKDDTIFIEVWGRSRTVPAQVTADWDVELYAGPLDRRMLGSTEPYDTLNLSGLVLYSMGTCCTMCTFQWLAKFLLMILGFLHDYVLFDWGMAIIGLVLIVRAVLHPLTKRAQINMQRFGRVMQKIKPEIEKVQKRYKDEPRKAQQEQLRLMQEHGVSPLQMLGCLPMLLQMPIWIALWAGLYFAYELWQQPAFYGIFQMFGGWSFLADLSAADHFIKFPNPIPLFMGITITGFNVLPILMGAVFFVQQKYLTPPPSATMSEDQIRQQKIMRVMMVVLFPIMLYTAPSGLTLYIMTSSLFGIIESKYIRSHIDAMDLEPKRQPVQKKSKKKSKDPMTRAYSDALDRAKDKRRRGPTKSFKKRK